MRVSCLDDVVFIGEADAEDPGAAERVRAAMVEVRKLLNKKKWRTVPVQFEIKPSFEQKLLVSDQKLSRKKNEGRMGIKRRSSRGIEGEHRKYADTSPLLQREDEHLGARKTKEIMTR